MNFYRYAAPAAFYPVAARCTPWFAIAAIVCALLGLYLGFVVAPTDAQQGQAYRIIFIHVPAAWMSMFIWIVMAFWSVLAGAITCATTAMFASTWNAS